MTQPRQMSEAETPMAARRTLLATTPNPGQRQDYMVMLEGTFAVGWTDHPVRATLRYVADRCVLSLDAFNAYLDALTGGDEPTLEAVAMTMLDDVNNELIPRWAQVELTAGPGRTGDCHRVIIEDRQPGWDNPTLLARHGAPAPYTPLR